jgi:predicted nucleic acid-binding protein
VTVYAETSALLRWILGQADGEAVRGDLAKAAHVVTSALTVVECERALVRLAATVDQKERAAARALLLEAARHWTLIEVDASIRVRAGQPFPVEPVRTLDAIHLATLLELEASIGPLEVLSTDTRVVENARALGFAVRPAA